MIGFPLVLPMGWAESPPAFCAGTETVADLANATLATNMQSLDIPQCLDALSETAPKIVNSEMVPNEPSKIGNSFGPCLSTDSALSQSQFGEPMTLPFPSHSLVKR